jgi:YtkA-like
MSPRCVSVVRASLVFPLTVVFPTLVLTLGMACSSSSSSVVDGGAGIVQGEADNHCMGMEPIPVSQASCHAAANPDAGTSSGDGGAMEELPVHFGSEADDDDCKYHASFTTTPVLANTNVTFNVTVTHLAGGAPATNADVVLESYMADNLFHVIPNNGTKTTETPANSGKYVMKPIKFDQSGRWVVRFHFYETCADILEDSPHGHVAFFYDVP